MTGQQIGGTAGALPAGMHPAMLGPEPPAEPPRRRREGLLIALATALGAAVVLGALIGFQQWRSDRDEVAATETAEADVDVEPPTAAPSTDNGEESVEDRSAGDDQSDDEPDDEPADADQEQPDAGDAPDAGPDSEEVTPSEENSSVTPVACPVEYDQVICDAADFVQQSRGRPFKEFPVIELLEDAEFDSALLDDFEEYEDELLDDERVLKSLGLIPVDLDLRQAFRELLESGVVGFYDPETKRLVVRGGDFDLYGQLILVHELVHAFDDQWFDLNRDDFPNEDAEYGFSAVVEGNASRVEDQWRASLSIEERSELNAQELGSLSLEDLTRLQSLPQVILGLQASPYVDGQRYVDNLFTTGGEEAVDQRLTEPPESSERVLNPDLDEEALVIDELQAPPTDGVVVGDGTLGELLIGFWLGDIAARGWGGDRYGVWEQGDGACLAVDLAADTPTDLLELETAASRWQAADEANRSVETVATASRTLLRVTGCY